LPATSLDLSIIESRLATTTIGRPAGSHNELWNEIDSTNTRAFTLAKAGAGAGTIILAKSQTAGRGRFGRSWLSPSGAGLYMSVLLRPGDLQPSLSVLTIAAGLAVARAVEITTGLKIKLKWVNDLVFDGRKLGGILTEVTSYPNQNTHGCVEQAVVIGIGINLSGKDVILPGELVDKVLWLDDVVPGTIDVNFLVSQIAYELEHVLANLSAGQFPSILDHWRGYCATLGEKITAVVGEKTVSGLALDVNESGALIVQTPAGKQELQAGEVTIRTSDGRYY
jgi:BirA family biotin operon repressor/biotin-[acetyl-CoA-carboxylase] ligase